MTAVTHWDDVLREVMAGRPAIVAMDVLVGASATAAQLRDLGVTEILPVAGIRGIGEVDPADERDAIVVGMDADGDSTSMMAGIRAWQAIMDEPPADLRGAVEAFDPDGRAWVVPAIFHVGGAVLGRPVLGARPAAWLALEDKTTVDALWDAAGVARAPSRVVELDDTAAVAAAVAALDRGDGTCWVADNTTGWHGGGEYLRWTGPQGDAGAAVAELRATGSRRARAMPFLEGRPCSIHGWVFDDHVAALRPCEMVVWRDDDHRFAYGGVSTVWEPPALDRAAMQDVARRVGRHLRDAVDYRGSFSVDGVLTRDGFLPTELNPRFGGGLLRVGAGIDLPIYLLHLASVSRPNLDWRPQELEAAILAGADASPVGRVMRTLPPGAATGTWHLRRRAEDWGDLQEVGPDEAEVVVNVGPGITGAPLAMVHLPGLPPGAAAAPVGARVVGAMSGRLGVAVPALHAAPERGVPPRG